MTNMITIVFVLVRLLCQLSCVSKKGRQKTGCFSLAFDWITDHSTGHYKQACQIYPEIEWDRHQMGHNWDFLVYSSFPILISPRFKMTALNELDGKWSFPVWPGLRPTSWSSLCYIDDENGKRTRNNVLPEMILLSGYPEHTNWGFRIHSSFRDVLVCRPIIHLGHTL